MKKHVEVTAELVEAVEAEKPKLNRLERRRLWKQIVKRTNIVPEKRNRTITPSHPFRYEEDALTLGKKTGRRRRAQRANGN